MIRRQGPIGPLSRALCVVTLLTLVVVTAGVAGAQAPPPLPAVYYGGVEIVGPEGSMSAPVGTVVTAKIGGEVRGQVTVEKEGVYGEAAITAPKLIVTGREGETGAEIWFFVGERQARRTAVFEAGAFAQLDLQVEDSVAPVISNLTPADGSKVCTARPTVSASLSDDLAGVDVDDVDAVTMKINDRRVPAAVSAGGVTYTPADALSDGEHTVEVSAADRVGNVSTVSWRFTVDASAPEVSGTTPADGATVTVRRPAIGASLHDTSGFAGVTLEVDGQRVVEVAPGGTDYELLYQPAADLAEGPHTARVTARDAAGNVTERSWSFTVDTLGPAVSDVQPRDGSTVTTRRPTISAVVSDPSGVAAFEMRLDGVLVDAKLAGGRVSYVPTTNLADGTHTVQLTVRDGVGNTRTVTWSFVVSVPAGPAGPPPGPPAPPPGPPPPPPFPPAAPAGLIPAEELQVTVQDGAARVEVPAAAVARLLERGVYDATVEVAATQAEVAVPAAALGQLAEREGTFTVSTSVGQVTLEAAALDLAGVAPTEPVRVTLSQVSEEQAGQLLARVPPEMRAVGIVVDVNVMVGDARVESFARPVRLVVPCQPDAVEGQLFVHRLRPDGTLECVGGEPVRDAEGNIVGVAVELTRLSKYVAMEFRSTLEDIRGHWAERDVAFMAARDVVKGVAPRTYEPNRAVTRAEFCALLVRTLGIPQEMPAMPTFADVPKDRWYFGVVEVAYRAGLVKGVGEGMFAPDRTISRQELAVMLSRALGVAGRPVQLEAGEAEKLLARFSDTAQVASWAQEGVAAGVKAGLLKGYPEGVFAPADATSRAAAATVLARLLRAAGLL